MATFLLLLVAILTSQIVSWFLFRAARSAIDFPREHEGKITLHYAPSIRMAALVLPLAVFLLLLFLAGGHSAAIDPGTQTLLIWLMPVAAIIAAAVTAEAFIRRIYLDEQGICSVSSFGEKRMCWDDIKTVSFNRWSKMIVLRGKDGARLTVNPSLSGLAIFELMLFERVERHRLRAVLPAFLALQ